MILLETPPLNQGGLSPSVSIHLTQLLHSELASRSHHCWRQHSGLIINEVTVHGTGCVWGQESSSPLHWQAHGLTVKSVPANRLFAMSMSFIPVFKTATLMSRKSLSLFSTLVFSFILPIPSHSLLPFLLPISTHRYTNSMRVWMWDVLFTGTVSWLWRVPGRQEAHRYLFSKWASKKDTHLYFTLILRPLLIIKFRLQPWNSALGRNRDCSPQGGQSDN